MGFSLIELMAVIAIIAILLAMFLPALSAAKESGFRVKCGSNLRQWYFAIYNYSASNNGDFPGVTAWGANDIFSDRGGEKSYKQLQDAGILHKITQCPARKQPRTAWSGPTYYNIGWFATDYFHFFGRGDRPHGATPVWPYDPTSPAYSYYGWTSSYWSWAMTELNRSPVPNAVKMPRSRKTVLAYDRSWTPSNPGVYYDYPGFDGLSNHNSLTWWADTANYMLLDGSVYTADMTKAVYLWGHDYYRWFVVPEALKNP